MPDLSLATSPSRPFPAIMDSEDTAKAMALSFLLLPPEVRVQIYGYLLISKDGFVRAQLLRDEEYYTGIARARRALSKSRPEYTRRFLPERAIIRTCSLIYSEAMAVLYKQNTFRYSCGSSIFNDEDYPKLGFPDQHPDRIKHLQIQVDPDRGPDEIAVDSVAATIEYLVTRGCDLQTFELLLD